MKQGYWRWLINHWPFMLKSRFLATQQACAESRARLIASHNNELEETKKRIDEHVRRLTDVLITPRSAFGRRYAITVEFSEELLGRYDSPIERQFIAERVSRQVMHEIATSRFLR